MKRLNDYDDVFKTMKFRHAKFFISAINYAFGTDYPLDVKAENITTEGYLQNQQSDGMIKINGLDSDMVLKINGLPYLMECQAYEDGAIALRIAEYSFVAAMKNAVISDGSVEMTFPRYAVVYVKSTKNTPKTTHITFVFPDGQKVYYSSDNIFIKDMTKECIIKKKMYAFIPFYITRYEKELSKKNGNLDAAIADLEYFRDCILASTVEGELSGSEASDLIGYINNIICHITDGNENERKLVQVMGGEIIESLSEKIAREAGEKAENRLIKLNSLLIEENRFEDLTRATKDDAFRKSLYAEFNI